MSGHMDVIHKAAFRFNAGELDVATFKSQVLDALEAAMDTPLSLGECRKILKLLTELKNLGKEDQNRRNCLKRFFRERNRIKLKAENPIYPPIYTQNIRILGKLQRIIRYYE